MNICNPRTPSFAEPCSRWNLFLVGTNGMIYTRTSVPRVDAGFKGRLPAVIQRRASRRRGGRNWRDRRRIAAIQGGRGAAVVCFAPGSWAFSAATGDAGAAKLRRKANGALAPEQENLLNQLRALKRMVAGHPAQTSPVRRAIPFPTAPSLPRAATMEARAPMVCWWMAMAFLNDTCCRTAASRSRISWTSTYLPAGITLANALNAVSNAMSAWASASSFKLFCRDQQFWNGPRVHQQQRRLFPDSTP